MFFIRNKLNILLNELIPPEPHSTPIKLRLLLNVRVRDAGVSGTASLVLKMAGDGGALKDINEIKSQFRTREGFYKLLTLSDSQQRAGLSRGPGVGGAATLPGGGGGVVPGPGGSSPASAGLLPPVRVSMVKLQPEDPSEESERVCFNVGRELYFYTYTNIKKVGVPHLDDKHTHGVFRTAADPLCV